MFVERRAPPRLGEMGFPGKPDGVNLDGGRSGRREERRRIEGTQPYSPLSRLVQFGVTLRGGLPMR
jgi:hypothetical protein